MYLQPQSNHRHHSVTKALEWQSPGVHDVPPATLAAQYLRATPAESKHYFETSNGQTVDFYHDELAPQKVGGARMMQLRSILDQKATR